VPYKSTGDVVNSMLGGNVDIAIDSMTTVWPHAKQGTVRALGVSTPQRSASAPDVPAIGETIKGFEATAWQGLFAPAGTPRPVIDKLNKVLREALASDEVRRQLGADGTDITPGTPEDYAAFIDKDEKKWSQLVKASGVEQE
jgi:tripartite-type tricarboxylate transporter receptor subunit TctC